MHRAGRTSIGCVFLLVLLPAAGLAGDAATVLRELDDGSLELEVLSRIYSVDREYRSMTGPWSTINLEILPDEEPQLVWIVGYRAEMVGPDGEVMPQSYMCHSNLDRDPTAHREIFGSDLRLTSRLFTLSQGQLEIDFPNGFGLPLFSSEEVELTTQVLDLNYAGGEAQVRHRVTLRFFRDRDLERSPKPLFAKGVYGLELLEGHDGYFGLQDGAKESKHGPGCLPGHNAAKDVYEDGLGRTFTGHWVVAPGRERNHTLVTRILNLPFDTRIHYIAVHLHPFAESVELFDLTAGETVFRSETRPPLEGIGLAHVDSFSSAEGLPVYKSHEYELVSVYNNTSGVPQDSMAVMSLYMADRDFKAPSR